MTYVYVIIDVATGDRLYVGITTYPERRLAAHRKRFGEVEMKLLQVCKGSEWKEAEVAWIARGRRLGWPLRNISWGGGRPVHPGDREMAAKISRGKKGWNPSPETRAAMSRAKKGKKQSPELVAKRVRGRKRRFTKEWQERLANATRERCERDGLPPALLANQVPGRKFSEAHVAKMRNRWTPELRSQQSARAREQWNRRKADA